MRPLRPLLYLGILVFVLTANASRADLVFLPQSRHPQYLTYGLFNEEQTTLVFRDSQRAWAALGDSLAVLEAPDWTFHPQFIIFGIVGVSFRENSWLLDFKTETFDARFGFAIEGSINDNLRFSVGLTHLSGHAADGILDQSLVAPNLGDDLFVARVIYDIPEKWRFGATFKPALNTDPTAQFFGADQFVEWYPLAGAPNFTGGAPYLAAGLEEYGVQTVGVTYHAQLGLLWGDHFKPEKKPAVRIVFGYYSGADPRLKYAQLLNSHASFFYGGAMINL